MYRWQTLTLAKIESWSSAKKTTALQLGSIKRFLLDIGLQHFPSPEVGYMHNGADPAGITMFWEVDDRELQATFQPDGQVGLLLTNSSGEPDQKWRSNPASKDVRDLIHRLLSGFTSDVTAE